MKNTLQKLPKDAHKHAIKKKLAQIKGSISKKLKELGEQQLSSNEEGRNRRNFRIGTVQGPMIHFSLP